jgi:hypothetical protein
MVPIAKTAHRLKVTIAGIRPPVWRRLLVPSRASLAELHGTIQEAFGWFDGHLHEFMLDGVRYGIDDGEGWGDPPRDERRSRLSNVAPKGARIEYVYDFGDDWVHHIVVEDIVPIEPAGDYPRCLAGRRAGPPEDVGGPYGYEQFLKAIADPGHKDHDDLLTWVGGSFDSDSFDLDGTNDSLTLLNP